MDLPPHGGGFLVLVSTLIVACVIRTYDGDMDFLTWPVLVVIVVVAVVAILFARSRR